MTSGRLTAIAIVAITAIFGIGLWYANVYAYYTVLERVEISLQRGDGTLLPLEIAGEEGIDADTSPLKFRACFRVEPALVARLLADAMPYADPTPLIAPGWFDCFDADAIGAALESGAAQAVLGQRNIADGIDRVVALFPDGTAYAWHQLNDVPE